MLCRNHCHLNGHLFMAEEGSDPPFSATSGRSRRGACDIRSRPHWVSHKGNTKRATLVKKHLGILLFLKDLFCVCRWACEFPCGEFSLRALQQEEAILVAMCMSQTTTPTRRRTGLRKEAKDEMTGVHYPPVSPTSVLSMCHCKLTRQDTTQQPGKGKTELSSIAFAQVSFVASLPCNSTFTFNSSLFPASSLASR